MKTYQEFVSEALMARPSLVPASLQTAQKKVVAQPVPATKPANNTATARPTPATATATPAKRPSLMQQAQELRAMRMRSMQRQGNTAGASAVRKTLPTAAAGASDQRAQQLNRVRNQARSATIANARGGQGMLQRSPVVQQQRPVVQQRPVPTARPVVQQQRPAVTSGTVPRPIPTAATGTPQTKAKPDIFTDTPVGGKPYGNAAKPAGAKPQQPKFRDEDLFTGQPLNPNTGKPVQQQPKFRDEDLFTGQKLNPNTGKPVQQQNNGRVVNDAGVTRVTDSSTGEINVTRRRTPEEQQRIKSALDISGGTTQAPSTSSNSSLSDDMIGKALAVRKATMMRGDGGEYSNMGKTPEEFRAKFNSLPPNRQRAILRRLSQ